jgi:L-methionine (R)-S-oxide reductase
MENSTQVLLENKNSKCELNQVEEFDTTTSINKSNKKDRYKSVAENLKLMYDVYDKPEMKLSEIAKMASISSAIKKEFDEFTFVGFYIVVDKGCDHKILEIGPYVSSILATPRIQYGKGVCGSTWEKKMTQIVNNVKKCHNYIACSPDVLSEIVIPLFNRNNPEEVIAVLDIDSKILDWFDEEDKEQLEDIIKNFA